MAAGARPKKRRSAFLADAPGDGTGGNGYGIQRPQGHSETEKGAAGSPVPPYSPAGPKLYQA